MEIVISASMRHIIVAAENVLRVAFGETACQAPYALQVSTRDEYLHDYGHVTVKYRKATVLVRHGSSTMCEMKIRLAGSAQHDQWLAAMIIVKADEMSATDRCFITGQQDPGWYTYETAHNDAAYDALVQYVDGYDNHRPRTA